MSTNGRGANMRVRISADLADIKQGLGVLRGELAKVKADAAKATPDANAWTSSLSRIRQGIGDLAGAYVGIQTIAGGFRALFDSIDRMDRIDELRQITGASAESLSRLAYAAKFGSVDIEVLGKGIVKVSKDITSGKSVISQLGIAIRDDLTGNVRAADDVLLDLADVFARLPDGPERAALAAKLFGDRIGPGLIPLLELGRKGIEDLGKEAAATGNVFSGEAVAGAAELNDNLDRLKLVAAGLANETAKNLVPSIAGYAQMSAEAGQSSGFAAEGGRILAGVLKVLSAGAIIVKNVVEAAVAVIATLGHTAAEVSGVVQRTLGRTLGLLAGTYGRLLDGDNPLTVLQDFWKGSASAMKATAAEIGGLPAKLSSALDAGKSSLQDAYADISRVGALFDEAGARGVAANDAVGKAAEAASPASQALLSAIRRILNEGGSGKPKAAEKIEQLANSTALLQDEVKRAQAALDQQLEDKTISVADYYARRVELQQRLIDLQIEQAEAELEVTKGLEQRRRLEEQIIILQRDRAEVAVNAARDEKKAQEELNKAKQDGLRDRYSNLTGNLSATEASISAQIDAGTLGYVEGERKLQEARQATLAQLKTLREEQVAYLATLAPTSPEYAAALQGLMGTQQAMANIVASMQELRQGAEDAGASALRTFFSDLKDDIGNAGEALQSLVRNFVDGLYQMAAEALSTRVVSAISGLFNKGQQSGDVTQGATKLASAAGTATIAGGILQLAGTTLGQSADRLLAAATQLMIANSLGSFAAAHGGGRAGALQMHRNDISPVVFGTAPRYHGGGVAGLANDEIPAILQRGETIRTKQQEAALSAQMDAARAGGRGGARTVTPVVAIGDSAVADAMAGLAGEDVVVTHVMNNWDRITRGRQT